MVFGATASARRVCLWGLQALAQSNRDEFSGLVNCQRDMLDILDKSTFILQVTS